MNTPREDFMAACQIHKELKAAIPFEAANVYLKIQAANSKSAKLGFKEAFHFTIFMKNTPKQILKTISLNNVEGVAAALEEVLASLK